MKDRKDIDRLFQERLKDFDAVPDEMVWNNIEEILRGKKKKRVIPIWFKLSGIAAALFLAFLLGSKIFKNDSNARHNEVVDNDSLIESTPHPIRKSNTEIVEIDIEVRNDSISTNDRTGQSAAEKPANSVHYNSERQYPNPERASVVASTKKSNNKRNTKNLKCFETEKVAGIEYEKQPGNGGQHDPIALKENQNIRNTELNSANTVGTDETKLLEDVTNNAVATSASENEKKLDTTVIAAVVPNALEELLKEKEVTKAEPKLNRWQITSSIAPVYFSSTSKGSPIDSRFENNRKTPVPSVSYGAGVRYSINKKLAIRTGISAVALEYNTSDIVFSQTPVAGKMQNVSTNLKGLFIQVDNMPSNSQTALGRTTDTQFEGRLNQKTGYIEVPFEMSYALIDKKFGLSLIGGLSTLFLNKNEVSILSNDIAMDIGEANNLNNLHFSTNVGVGFRYRFLKSFEANLEPIFKYQLNTYSNDAGNFRPYFFGLYSGVSFRF